MKKALIMTSVAFVLLLAVIAAGLNVIFTLTYVDASFSTFSAQGEEEAEKLKKELDGFTGGSTTFLRLSDVRETVNKYPCFRVESIKKKFPKTLEVTVTERAELFAYETADGNYAMIGSDGTCLRTSDENVSRTGGENILLKNFNLDVSIGKQAGGEDERYFAALLDAFKGFGQILNDAKANVRGVSLRIGGNPNNPLTSLFVIEMQEGVAIEMNNPLSKVEEKAAKAAEVYYSLGDIAKMYGCITVTESSGGTINAVYFEYGV